MIPNVCMAWCQRKAMCKWCNKPIEAGNPIVTVFYWRKGVEGNRKLNLKFYYHPQCWVDQGTDYLKMNPYVPHKRSRKLPLTKEDTERRVTLLRRKASLDQRKRNLKANFPDRVLAEARIDSHIAEIMVEIVSVGGIPKRWLE